LLASKLYGPRVDPETRRRLAEADWAEIGVRLTGYATWRAMNYRWRTGQVYALAAGETAEDIACHAIVKVLEGTRIWDPARGPLLPFLFGVVDSLLSHLATSRDNALVEPWQDGVSDQIAISPRGRATGAELIDRLRRVLERQGETDLLALLGAAQEHGPKPSAIAMALGMSVRDVNNRLKRLRRIALKVLWTTRPEDQT